MIKKFNDVETRESAIIYQSSFEQVKKLYSTNPQMAGELAIALCEVALTGQHSSDDATIDIILETFKVVSSKNKEKYDKTLEVKHQKKIVDQKLDKIAILLDKGCNQTQIAQQLGTTKQTISNRIKLIRNEFPELLSSEFCLTLDKNFAQPANAESQVKQNLLDDTLPEFDSTLQMLDVSSPVKSVKSVKCTDTDTVTDTVSNFVCDKIAYPLISLFELNQMGVEYEFIDEGLVKIVKTGNICQVKNA